MPDNTDLFNRLRPRLNRIYRPFLLILVALVLYGIGHVVYQRMLPAAAPVPTPAKPNGDWIGEITMDGRYWIPTISGDTPGPHRHAVFEFQLATTDSFLDHHAGKGSMHIVGESITRPFRAYDWQLQPDGTLQFGFLSTPALFQDEFRCEIADRKITCKPNGPMKATLSLYPGTPADADHLLQQVTQRAAIEAPLVAFPKTHEKVLCSDDYETQTIIVADDDPKIEPKSGKKQKKPLPCRSDDDD